MLLHFLNGAADEAPQYSVEFASSRELYRWLVGRPETFVVAFEASRGPVLLTGLTGGYQTVRGGLSIPQSDVDWLWDRAERHRQHENNMDVFLGQTAPGMVRRAFYPAPRLVADDDA